MYRKVLILILSLVFVLLCSGTISAASDVNSTSQITDVVSDSGDNIDPPSSTVRLVFIHHSTGENWLADGNGGLGVALEDNNYYVSDTNYGWGPGSIGDRTDIGNWWEWFRGPQSSTYLTALYSESGQHSSYSRLSTSPGGENEIIMFKSCFPNSALRGNPSDPVPSIGSNPLRGQSCGSSYHTVANAKGIYIDLLEYFKTRQDKLFIVITAPPLSDSTYAGNARAFNNWLVNDWLDNYPYQNVFVFDFYNVLTTNGGDSSTNDLGSASGNHHRWWDGAVQHVTSSQNTLAYPSGDDHPSRAGNLKATGEFVQLLNLAYNQWKSSPFTGAIHDVYPGGSIQNTINASSPQDIIMIHGNSGNPATYTENIVVNKQLLIRSSTDGTVTINALNSSNPTVTVTSGGSGSQIEGLNIQGASNSCGILLDSTANCTLTGNTVTGNNVGIKLYISIHNSITNNSIRNNGWAGICLDNSSENTINNSNNVNSNQEGIFLANNSNQNNISDNNIRDNTSTAISILGNSNSNTISSNTSRTIHTEVMGVFIQNSNNNVITDNTVENNSWVGICLDHATGTTVTGNEVTDNQEGVFLANSSTGNTISENNIHTNLGTGISLLSGSNNNFIWDQNLLQDGSISDNGVMGIFIQNSNNNSISGNYIQNNGWSGICLDHAAGTSITGASNDICGNQEGVFMANNSSSTYIGNNFIYSNTGNGISIINSNNTTIDGNYQISSNGVSGILVQNSTTTTVHENNMITNTWAGLVLDTATSTTAYQNSFDTNPEQALAVNGSGNVFYQGTTGNHWSDWTITDPRPIDGNENIFDQYPH